MKTNSVVVVSLGVALSISACSTQTAKSEGESSVASNVPADSPLAKVHDGMTKKEVSAILGPPTDEITHATTKSWVPLYFGDDVRRTLWFYKGIGRVVFDGGDIFNATKSEVVGVDYDPAESGVAR